MLNRIVFSLCFLVSGVAVFSQVEESEQDTLIQDDIRLIEKLKYIKQPGLANAASKIYSADRRYSISGFLELNNVSYLGDRNENIDDMELTYTGLYRLGTYLGYKITDRLIFNSELQAEFLHNGLDGYHFEYNLELIFDYLWKKELSFRVGNFPIPIGYVNVMEEPTAFYTVNRPEIERIMVPTQWLEPGLMVYGQIKKLEYNAGVVKGMDALNFSEGAWIRPGRYHWYENPQDLAGFGKLAYHGSKNFEVALAGYHGTANRGREELQTTLTLSSAYLQYDVGNLSFFGMGIMGWVGGTESLYNYQLAEGSTDEEIPIIGRQTLGYYGEVRWDILPYFKETDHKLPLFFRYERLNTHVSNGFGANTVQDRVIDEVNVVNYTFGINYRPKKHIALKANYTLRSNQSIYPENLQPNRFEIGLGLIF